MNDFKMATNRKQILKLTTSMTKIPELQSGRSMIEMLGVLAIIGVLSIGGVATFQYAMTKDKANKLIYDINLLREQTLTNAADVPAENFEPESGYQMSSRYGEGGIVSIMIDDLDKDVCERLLSMRFEDLRFLHAEQNTDILSCEGTPSFRAVFGLGDNAIIDEDACVIPCDSNHECHERRCCPKLTEGQCSATASGCPTQVADDGTPCGTNQVCDDGECVCGLECEGEFVPNGACDACECGLGCANGGTPNESCTACENCDNSYGGTYCEVCEQNCQNSGTPIQNCSACDCVNSWEGDNCETCGLSCQNGGAPNEDCSACDCPEPWDGADCTTCTLQQSSCPQNSTFNSISCSCECNVIENCETYDEKCACVTCLPGYLLEENGTCRQPPCGEAMLAAGYTQCSDTVTFDCFTVDGSTITLKRPYAMDKAVSIPHCDVEVDVYFLLTANLIVNNLTLGYDAGDVYADLTVNNLTVLHELRNYGNINANKIKMSGLYGKNTGTINANYMDVEFADGFDNIGGIINVTEKASFSSYESTPLANYNGTITAKKMVLSPGNACEYGACPAIEPVGTIYVEQFCSNKERMLINGNGDILHCTNMDACSCGKVCYDGYTFNSSSGMCVKN